MKDLKFTGKAEIEYEDGDQSAIIELPGCNGTFVRLQSWSEIGSHHAIFKSLAGKQLEVTVKVIE